MQKNCVFVGTHTQHMPHYECFSAEHNLSWRQRRPSLTWTDCFVWIELPLGSAGFQPEPEKRTLGVHRIRLCAEQSTSAELLLWESSRATISLRGSTTNCVSFGRWRWWKSDWNYRACFLMLQLSALRGWAEISLKRKQQFNSTRHESCCERCPGFS